jgi:hypothetical protein
MPNPSPLPPSEPKTPVEQPRQGDSMDMHHGLLVMKDDQMFITVGRNSLNLMPMGRMGSGTSWQPASSPMRCYTNSQAHGC